MDDFGNLWVLDSGTVNIDTCKRERICSPKLLIFQMSTNTLTSEHIFSKHLLKSISVLQTFTVDAKNDSEDCEACYAYIADTTKPGMIVFDRQRGRAWRIEVSSFHPNPKFGNYILDNTEFNMMRGLNSLALSPRLSPKRKLFYYSWSSDTASYVITETLKNQTYFTSGSLSEQALAQFITYPKKRQGRATVMGVSKAGKMFFGNLHKSSITCWDTSKDYDTANFYDVDVDTTQLRFVTGLKIIKRTDGTEEVWVLSNNYHKFKTGKMNDDRVNHRIMTASVTDLIKSTKC